MEATGRPVRAVLELPAGVQRAEDDFQRTLLRLGVPIHRNPAAIVGDGHGGAIGMERDADVGGVAVHGLVDRVVDDLPDKVMESD